MALPIAHATAGYLVQRLDRRATAWSGWTRALAFAAIGNLPDVDFLFGFLLGRPGVFHRGVSHTVVAALVFGVAAGAFLHWRRLDRWWPAMLLCTAAYASHLLVDAFTIDQRPPVGAQFFWPLSDAYFIAPLTIFSEILIDGRSRAGFIRSVVAWPTVAVLAREALIALVALACVRVVELGRGMRPTVVDVTVLADSGEEDLA
jgi:inner membrane protein